MAVTWTIEGESGANWDATARAPEYYGIGSGTVATGSIEGDRLDLTAVLADYQGTTYARPTNGQRVTLRRNGTVYFRGWAIDPKASAGDAFSPRSQVTVVGPWYWLRKQPLRSTRQATGFVSAASRNQLVLASGQTLAQNLTTLANAYNDTLGALDQRRISIGSIATTWSMQFMSISGGDFLSAIMEVLRSVPDAVAYWVYQSGTHVAALHVTRRDTMTTRTIVSPGDCQGADFHERTDMESDGGVVIDYAEMVDDQSANTGKPRYLQQASNSSFSGAVTATARAQRLTSSGPEVDSFLPDSPVENVTVTSAAIAATILRTRDSGLAAIPSVTEGLNTSSLAVLSEEPGVSATLASHPYYLTAGDPRDWWDALPANLQLDPVRVKVSATYRLSAYGINLSQSPSYPWGYYSRPTGLNGQGYMQFQQTALSEGAFKFFQLASVSTEVVDVAPSSSIYQAATLYTASYNASASVTAVRLLVSNLTLYKRPDFQFYTPPSNLANNLSKAQNFTPWEGTARRLVDNPGDTAFAGCKLDVDGLLPEWETMGAMVRSHQIDLFTGSETVECGPPDRLAHLNLAVRLRVDPQGNITYL